MALSSFGFADLARAIVTARPTQANFILDACQSGGLGLDLPAILKASLTGTMGSTGVAAIAAAAADESALEVDEGGVFTTELLKMLSGETVVQKEKPYIGLPDIGSFIHIDASGEERQTVTTWLLNLQGPNRFSHNPHYAQNGSMRHDGLMVVPRRLNLGDADIHAIRRITFQLREEINELELARLLEKLTGELNPDDAATLLSGLVESLAVEAEASTDPFAESRVLGVLSGQLLRYTKDSILASTYLHSLLERKHRVTLAALRKVDDEIGAYKYRLISVNVLADLYFLPHRITDILGQIGSMLLLNNIGDGEILFLKGLTNRILEIYGNSVLAVSDEQACPVTVFLAGCIKHQWNDISEEVICRLYKDSVDNFGRFAAHFLSGEEALTVLEQRYHPYVEPNLDLYQAPSGLATVIIFFGALCSLDDVLDQSLILIDHTPLNFLIVSDIHEIGRAGPINGQNLGYTIGRGIWRCIGARREWNTHVIPLFENQLCRLREVDLQAGIAACLSLRDRVPWIVVARVTPDAQGDDFCKVYFEDGLSSTDSYPK